MLINIFKKEMFKRKWRKINQHNSTKAINIFNLSCIKVGKYTYGGIEVFAYNDKAVLKIGNYCSIAPKVRFILSSDHKIDTISSFPFKVKCLNYDFEAITKGDIIIDDDVWIGDSAKILSGVHIGQGAVIAAGAVVSKNVPPYAVVGGVPAKIIKYRFSDDMIKELLKVDYSKLTKEMIIEHENELYTKLTEVGQLEWMPKK